jgi:hypothetical protein
MASRVLTKEEVAGLQSRHYWDGWNWWGLGPEGQVVNDEILGSILASKDASGREWYIADPPIDLVAWVNQAGYESDPQYAQAIAAAVEWEVEMAKKLFAAVAAGAKGVAEGARDTVKPLLEPLTFPLMLVAGVAVGVLLLAKGR